MGDATNAVLIIAGELLKKAEYLLIMGLHPSEITRGYELAAKKGLEELESVYLLRDAQGLDLMQIIRTLEVIITYTLDEGNTFHCLEACHRLQAIWL